MRRTFADHRDLNKQKSLLADASLSAGRKAFLFRAGAGFRLSALSLKVVRDWANIKGTFLFGATYAISDFSHHEIVTTM